ncbi:beta-lactamase/transpeptidase-like protein, partial [Marasmius fiardii PR-910]
LYLPLFIGAFSALAQNIPGQVLTPEVDSFIEEILLAVGSFGGVSVTVVRLDPNGVWNVETKGYGIARLSDNTSITPNTLFPIGSDSKVFTTIAAGLLISNKSLTPRLSWETKLASIIQDWELADSFATEKSSIIDLMAHRMGLLQHDYMYHSDDTLASVYCSFRLIVIYHAKSLSKTYQYNSIMYFMLSYLSELVLTKMPLTHYVKENIFEPLGMNSTTYSFDVVNATGKLAYGISQENLSFTDGLPGTGTPHQMPFWEDGNIMSGAGTIISSANDMATWLQTLLLLGKNLKTNETIIPPAVIQKVSTGVTVASDGISGYVIRNVSGKEGSHYHIYRFSDPLVLSLLCHLSCIEEV